QHGLAVLLAIFEAGYIAFFCKHTGDGQLDLRRRHGHHFLVRRLPVPDAGEHVGYGVSHTHLYRYLYLFSTKRKERVRALRHAWLQFAAGCVTNQTSDRQPSGDRLLGNAGSLGKGWHHEAAAATPKWPHTFLRALR